MSDEYIYDEYEEFDEDYDPEEEMYECPEGWNFMEECCGCLWRLGRETCEFLCPAGGPPLPCLNDECIKQWAKEMEVEFEKAKEFWYSLYEKKYKKKSKGDE